MNAELDALELLARVREGISVRTAIGEPVSQDGLTMIPVARVSGAGGGGGGTGPGEEGHEPAGTGAGFAMTSKPLGAFVIKDGEVGWRPTVDVNKIILGAQVVAVVALLVVRSLVRRRRRGAS